MAAPDHSPPAVICFDVFGTILKDPFREAIEATVGLPLDQILSRKDPESWPRFERGECGEEEYFAHFFRDGEDRSIDGPRLREKLREGYAFLPGMEDLLQRLSARVLLYAMSNYPVWFEELRERFSLDRFFAGYFLSHRLGVRKPDPAFFEAFFDEVAVARSATLLVDDDPTNVEAARRFGMQAHSFRGVEALEAELRALTML